MKKVLFGCIIVMAVILTIGISWGNLFKRGYTQDEYGQELTMRDQRIEELEDSIMKMQLKQLFRKKTGYLYEETDN